MPLMLMMMSPTSNPQVSAGVPWRKAWRSDEWRSLVTPWEISKWHSLVVSRGHFLIFAFAYRLREREGVIQSCVVYMDTSGIPRKSFIVGVVYDNETKIHVFTYFAYEISVCIGGIHINEIWMDCVQWTGNWLGIVFARMVSFLRPEAFKWEGKWKKSAFLFHAAQRNKNLQNYHYLLVVVLLLPVYKI